jgi:hypothetical protein
MSNENWSQSDYKTLCSAIAQGVVKVKYGDKEVDYRSLPEMLRIKALMESALGIGNKTYKKKVACFTKGIR